MASSLTERVGMSPSFSVKSMLPSWSTPTMTSGVICVSAELGFSPMELPGRGFKRLISWRNICTCWSESLYFCCIRSHLLWLMSSQLRSNTFKSKGVWPGTLRYPLRLHCMMRHSCRLRAPTPGGSKRQRMWRIRSTSSGVVSQ